MKLTTFLLLVSVLGVLANESYSQTLDLKMENATLKEVLSKIEDISQCNFLYSEKFIDVQRKVSINFENTKLDDALKTLFTGIDIDFERKERIIILSQNTGASVQQTKTISGKVTDSSGQVLPGVSITVKGTTLGIITDAQGNYSLPNVPSDATLVFSFVGMKDQQIAIAGKTNIKVTLEEETVGIEEVVAIGYGTQKKASLTGSISTIRMDDEIRDISTSNLSSVLAGTMAGVRVNSPTGVPGVASTISIRTNSSWNSTPPVFVIDGVVSAKSDFDRMNANEIENISILKDAASAAIYGSRASGGVILVTTKQGKQGKAEIRYSGSYAVEKRGIGMPRASGVEVAEMANYVHRDNLSHWAAWDQDEIDYIKTINNGWGYDVINDNWRNPVSQNHTLSLLGGTDKVKYFVNGSFFGQNAFLKNVDYHKYNIRSNIEANVSENLKVVAQLSNTYADRDNVTYGSGSYDLSDLYSHMLNIQPYMPTHTSDGKPVDWGWIGNLGEFTNTANSGYVRSGDQTTESLFRLEYSLPGIKGLTLKSQFAYKSYFFEAKNFLKKQELYQVKKLGSHGIIWTDEIIGTAFSSTPSKETIEEAANSSKSYQLNLQIDYARKFGKHELSALAVYEQNEGKSRSFSGARENFPVVLKDQFLATSSAREDSWVNGEESEYGRISYVGQVNYGYDQKYLLNASLRVDGSMNFPEGQRYGYFPAVSGAWILSKENFFHSNKIDMLKLRSSVGLTGNDNIIGWQWQDSYVTGNAAYLGANPTINQGIRFGGIVNPNVTWEKALSYNIGLDVYLFDHINLTADFWRRKTYDILGARTQSTPTTFGFTMPSENYGEVHARGVDIEIGYHSTIRDFKYHINGTFSYSGNKVIVKDYPVNSPDYGNPIGRPLGYIAGYRDAGIIRTQEQLDEIANEYRQSYGKDVTVFGYPLELGMLMYHDLSGPDGDPDGKIDSYDQDNICNYSTPPISAGLTLGFEWKGFSAETLFQGDFGYKRGLDWRYLSFYEWNRFPTLLLDHWSLETPDGHWPEPKASGSFASYNALSTFTVRNASFIKMRYINLSYNVPKRILNNYTKCFKTARLFFSATNLLTITKFTYWDPELPSTGSYPNMKTLNFGLEFTL